MAWAGLLAIGLFGVLAIPAVLLRGSGAPGPSDYVAALLFAVSELAFAVATWVFGVRKPRGHWRDLGVRGFNPLVGCLGAATMLFFTLCINITWGFVLRALGWAGQPPMQPLFGKGPVGLAVAMVGVAVVAPFAEEIFFRGFAYPALRQRLALWLAIVVDAALFALLHFTPTLFPPMLIMGAFFCLLYQYTGSIWPGVLLHGSINLLSVLSAYLIPR